MRVASICHEYWQSRDGSQRDITACGGLGRGGGIARRLNPAGDGGKYAGFFRFPGCQGSECCGSYEVVTGFELSFELFAIDCARDIPASTAIPAPVFTASITTGAAAATIGAANAAAPAPAIAIGKLSDINKREIPPATCVVISCHRVPLVFAGCCCYVAPTKKPGNRRALSTASGT